MLQTEFGNVANPFSTCVDQP